MLSVTLIVVVDIIFLLEIILLYLGNKENDKPPKKEEYEKYISEINSINNYIFTLATLTMAILVIFFLQGSHVGTQTILINGLSLLFMSAFLREFSGQKKIVYFIRGRTLYYWFYSVIFAILTLYINPSFDYNKNSFGIIITLLAIFLLIVLFHLYSFYLEWKNN